MSVIVIRSSTLYFPNIFKGDGLFNPAGYGNTCDKVAASLKPALSAFGIKKVETLAMVPNPRNSDVFFLGYVYTAKDKVLTVMRMVMDGEGRLGHVYYMSQVPDARARQLLKNPEK